MFINFPHKTDNMKKALVIISAALIMAACGDSQKRLTDRAEKLCAYIPDHEMLEKSKEYLTPDFYAILDTMFYRLPNHEAMDHQWEHYFVTGYGNPITDYTVTGIVMTDDTHAIATISVVDETSETEEHFLHMEKAGRKWLMSDFDGHKQDCIRYIENNRKEQALRDAISDYLVNEIGQQYRLGEYCIPTLMIVREEEMSEVRTLVWGDFWVYWYNVSGDTLNTVSGGNHSGCMTLRKQNGKIRVTAFEQTVDGAGNDASARRIFGDFYDIYHNMHSNQDVREAVRQEQLTEYVNRHGLNIHYYYDYGWDAVGL